MAKDKIPVTPAVRLLRAQGVSFTPRPYDYEEKGGTARASRELGEDEHRVIKTLLFEDEARKPLIVLMHGDRQVSTKALARALGVRQINPCDPASVTRHTGYQVGGVSPFGTRHPLPVYVQESILELGAILINGGKRGFLVEIDPAELLRVLGAKPVRACQA
ncbi:MAG: Cys-tRNA(Pro) deacylase [Pseudomonadota bacterium]